MSQYIPFLRAQFVFYIHNTALQRLTCCDLSMYDCTQQLTSCPSSCMAYYLFMYTHKHICLPDLFIISYSYITVSIFSAPGQKAMRVRNSKILALFLSLLDFLLRYMEDMLLVLLRIILCCLKWFCPFTQMDLG